MSKPDTDPKLEQANRDVAECLLARIVVCPPGCEFTGQHLLTWRNLPSVEREYFDRLTAPIVDRHLMERVAQVGEPDESGHREVTYTPPYPTPCECDAPAYLSWSTQWVRCAACLSSFPIYMSKRAATAKRALSFPIIESVFKSHIGSAMKGSL